MTITIKFIAAQATSAGDTSRLNQQDDPSATFTAITTHPGQSLMKAAVAANVEGIAADCGGTLTCATCHVYVEEPWPSHLPAPQADEQVMLEMTAAPREAHSRLSCQVQLTQRLDGLCVRLPPTQY